VPHDLSDRGQRGVGHVHHRRRFVRTLRACGDWRRSWLGPIGSLATHVQCTYEATTCNLAKSAANRPFLLGISLSAAMTEECNVGGLKCSEVLEHLSEFVDGELDEATVNRVRLHLAGCANCEQFGGRFAKMVSEFRRQLGVAQPAPEGVQAALYEALGIEVERR
jgi:hypothetical protein